jgi:DNA-binding transcriptional ArsR family regulator
MGRSQDEVGAVTGTPATPLDHRVRRCVLRCLHGSGPLTPAEITRKLRLELKEALYHLDVLAEYGLTRERQRGGRRVETSFESQIADDDEIIELLVATRAEDEAQS